MLIWTWNGLGSTQIGADVYSAMFLIPAVLSMVGITLYFAENKEARALRIACAVIPVVVLAGWALLVSTEQVITHAELMRRR